VLLGSVYSLHDVPDVEQLCVRGARRWCANTHTRLTAGDFDDLIAFLVAAVWRMSERYDPERSSSFRAIVLNRLGNRCTDWMRSHCGRTRWQFSTTPATSGETVSTNATAGGSTVTAGQIPWKQLSVESTARPSTWKSPRALPQPATTGEEPPPKSASRTGVQSSA
jgi:hypothetical protein